MDATYFKGLILLVLGLEVAHCCDQSGIASCISSFATSIKGKNLFESEQVFDNYCNNEWATYKSCLSGKTTGCGIVVKKTFEGVFHSYTYMCGTGKSATVQYGACSESTTNKASLSVCIKTMNTKIANDPSKSRRCGYLDDYLTCAVDATKSNCGSGSGTWYDKVISLATGPLLEEAGCGCSGLTATITLLVGAFLFQWLSR